jgi:hypothetical protein
LEKHEGTPRQKDDSYREGERKGKKCHMVDSPGEVSDDMLDLKDRTLSMKVMETD